MNKPWLLIAGSYYYPCGTLDWVDRFATKEEAKAEVHDCKNYFEDGDKFKVRGERVDWFEIVNLETWEPEKDVGVVLEADENPCEAEDDEI